MYESLNDAVEDMRDELIKYFEQYDPVMAVLENESRGDFLRSTNLAEDETAIEIMKELAKIAAEFQKNHPNHDQVETSRHNIQELLS